MTHPHSAGNGTSGRTGAGRCLSASQSASCRVVIQRSSPEFAPQRAFQEKPFELAPKEQSQAEKEQPCQAHREPASHHRRSAPWP